MMKMKRPRKPVRMMKMACRVKDSHLMRILEVEARPKPQPRPNRRDRVRAMTKYCLYLFLASFLLPDLVSFLRRSEMKMMMKMTQLKRYTRMKGARTPP